MNPSYVHYDGLKFSLHDGVYLDASSSFSHLLIILYNKSICSYDRFGRCDIIQLRFILASTKDSLNDFFSVFIIMKPNVRIAKSDLYLSHEDTYKTSTNI